MNAPFRRGACPGLSQPMPTGDGLLVRLTPTGATIRPEAFIALCAAARSCGNGVIEITSRGSIQVRGLTERSVERLAAMIGRIDLPVSDGPAVMCDCLAGLDDEEVLDAGALAAQLRGAIASVSFIADLEPKVSVAVDGGGALHLEGVPADVRLRAMASDGRVYLHVSVGGDAAAAQPIGAVASEHAVEAALRMLDVIAAGRARARAIVAGGGAGAFRRAIADIRLDLAPPRLRPPSESDRHACAARRWHGARLRSCLRARGLDGIGSACTRRGECRGDGSAHRAGPCPPRHRHWQRSCRACRRQRRGAGLHRARGGSAPSDRRLRRGADLCCGGNSGTRAGAGPCGACRNGRPRRADGACVGLCQGLRLCAFSTGHGRGPRRPLRHGGQRVRPRPAARDADAGGAAGRTWPRHLQLSSVMLLA